MTEKMLHQKWDNKLPRQFVEKIIKISPLYESANEHLPGVLDYVEEKFLSFTYKLMQSEQSDHILDADDMMFQLEGCLADDVMLSNSQRSFLEEIAEDMYNLIVNKQLVNRERKIERTPRKQSQTVQTRTSSSTEYKRKETNSSDDFPTKPLLIVAAIIILLVFVCC